MTAFLICAALCGAAALLFVLRPWLQGAQAGRSRLLPIAIAAIALAAAAALYNQLSNWPWRSPPPVNTVGREIGELLRATRAQPQDGQSWLRLGQAYLQIEQLPMARRAFERANELAGGTDAAALSGLAESMVLGGDAASGARAAELFERALQIDPRAGKALFYTALAAMQAGNPQLARDRFATMLTLDAPPEVRNALTRQIAALDEQLKAGSSPAAASSGTQMRVRITVDPALAGTIPANAVLFVFVRNTDGGPPLAARRLNATFPQVVTLSASDAMIEGNAVKPGQRVRIVARVSRTGTPTAQPDDPAGEIEYVAGKEGEREILVRRPD